MRSVMRMSRIGLIVLIVWAACLVMAGCRTGDGAGDDGGFINLKAAGDSDGDPLPAESNPEQEQQNMQDLPMQEGGSEKEVRPQRPSSNRALQQQYPGILVLHGPYTEKKAALTFDDGPDRLYTPMVLDVLKKYGVKATFFLMGSRAAALPEMTKRIVREGHALGNHTYWHPKLYEESLGRLHWEVTETDQALASIAGYRTRLFRAPYGGLTAPIVERLGSMGYSVIGWSVDSQDWRQPGVEQIKRNVIDAMHPGAIVLMHTGGDWTLDLSDTARALDEIIPEMQAQGYEWVTVPELLGIGERR